MNTLILRKTALIAALIVGLPVPVSAASIWRDVERPAASASTAIVERWLQLDEAALRDALQASAKQAAGISLSLPMPYGGERQFLLRPSDVMAPELAARFPELQTFSGVGISDPLDRIRLELSPQGVSAMVFATEGVSVLRWQAASKAYQVFQRETALSRSHLQCGFDPARRPFAARPPAALKTVGPSLRRYRTAIAATGEYTAFFGGTKQGAMAGIVAAVNRVNGVLENEVGVTLQLIGNNDALVYTNGNTDPYTDDDPEALLEENQTNTDSVIGSANYDFGHVFSTGGGGIAQLEVPCENGFKAQGVTGSDVPDQDPFWIDYVAHEMGHQLGAFHTFNDGSTDACGGGNRDASTAYEPGSGSTIMAYAGICGSIGNYNLQSNSDAYFHVASLAQMHAFAQSGSAGASCGTTVSTGNSAPTITQTRPQSNSSADAVIPARTPFFLDATVTDSNAGDTLSYTWEQLDAGSASPPMTDNGNRAIIRSFSPSASPIRHVPRVSNLLAGTTVFGEALPTTSRTLRFRLTARDNHDGGGGVHWSGESGQATDVVLQVVNTGSAFQISSLNSSSTLTVGSSVALTWAVAGTRNSPISCPTVVLGWSADGGQSFLSQHETSLTNSGDTQVTVPALIGNQVRIRLRCASSPFFDINDANLTIEAAALSDLIFRGGFEP